MNIEQGFGIADGSIVSTFDGGLTWTSHADPPSDLVDNGYGPAGYDSGIAFVSAQRGWVWGSTQGEVHPNLSFTEDGGYHWKQVAGLDNVVDVRPEGSSVWAFTSSPLGTRSAATSLWESTDSGTTWRPSPAPLSADRASILAVDRVGLATAYVVAQEPSSARQLELIETTNAGRSWTVRPALPVGCTFEGTYLSSHAQGQLLLACGGQPGAGQQAKAIYRSPDGGITWRLVAASQGPTGVPVTGSLTVDGYITGLDDVNSATAYLGLGRGPLLETTDGGTNWTVAASNYDSAGLGVVLAPITATKNVALIAGQSWRTTNGTTWAPMT